MKSNFKKIIFVLISVMILSVVSVNSEAAQNVKSVEDLKSAIVGVQSGSVAESLVRELAKDSQTNIITFENVSNVVDALKAKKIDAAVMDEAPARYFVANEEGLAIVQEALQSDVYAIAFKKHDTALKDKVNGILREFHKDGTIEKIIAKYTDYDNLSPSEIDFNKNPNYEKLWVGCAASFPPYEMRDERGFYGIDIELCSEIAKKLGMELVIADYRFDVLMDALIAGKVDMICSSLIVSPEREEFIDFSEHYEANQELILVLSEAE